MSPQGHKAVSVETSGAAHARRILSALAMLAACAFVVLLGIRTLTTPDLGYHLAYGDHFLETGEIVDSSLFVYTARDRAPPGEAGRLGPGCWYDANGRYRFPNANWLSQVIMAVVHRQAGLKGLSVLLAALVAAILAVGAATMRRAGLGWAAAAGGMLLMAMVAYERFLIRPEVFGYLILAAQLCLLVRGRASRPAVAGLIVLQLLLVNVHSYFLLGLGLTGAFGAEQLLRWLWHRLRSGGDAEARRAAASGARRWGIVLAGQVVVCFINPWTWRLAVLPLQTLAFMRKYDIAAGPGEHPWSHIGEFFRPFATGVFADSKASYAYLVLLALAAVGAIAAAVRRRWALLLILVAMTAVSLSMRRNIAPAALIIVPVALAACRELLAALADRMNLRPPPALVMTVAGALTAAAAVGCLAVLTQWFYRNERLSMRFGLGVTPAVVPVGAAEWINQHKPAGRLWTDYNTSSNVHYFTRPHRDVPILTNTWAYPPWVMRRSLDYSIGKEPFSREADVQIVVLQVGPKLYRDYVPLAPRLANDPSWAMVYLDTAYAVFLRRDGPNAELARRSAITPASLGEDVEGFVKTLRGMDPIGSHAVYLGGYTLSNLGWYTQALALYRKVLDQDPYPHRVWTQIGWCLAHRGTRRMLRSPPDLRGREDWQEARRCFLKALRLEPSYEDAQTNLRLIEDQIAHEKLGIIYSDPWAPLDSARRR